MAITAADIKNLRDQTGVGMMECKKALTEAEGDVEKALVLLRERGAAAAAKKAGRIAAEGVAYPFFCSKCNVAGVVEINTETDFAAKNEKFTSFAADIAKVIMKENPSDVADLLTKPFDADQTVDGALKSKVLTIGENIQIRRFVRLQGGANTVFAIYNHHTLNHLVVIVTMEVSDNLVGNDEVVSFGKDLAMTVASMRPEFVSEAEVPAERMAAEREILKVQVMNEGKPAAIAEKIVNGRIGKFYEECCLMDQAYIRDMKISNKAAQKELEKKLGGTIAVKAFVRIECGEGIEKREDNFAEEVAKMAK